MSQLSEIISELSQNCLYLKALKQAKRLYTVNVNDLKTISPFSVFQLLKKLNCKADPLGTLSEESQFPCENLNEECWYPSEFKLFSWIAVCYAFTIGNEIHEFKSNNLDFITNIFRKKRSIFIEYNLLSLQRQPKGKKEEWSPEEKTLFLDILKDDRLKGKWSDISYNLYCKSDQQFFRSSHNCREMWYNHLNPVVNHSKWTLQQDIQLFVLANKLGTKWARISKALEGVRTEHMVKNRFNSITKKYQSRFQRCSQKKMIQLITFHLEKKLVQEQEKEDDSNSKDNQVNSQSDPSVKKEESIIEEEEEEEHEEEEKGQMTEENIKKEESEPQQSVVLPISQIKQQKIQLPVPVPQTEPKVMGEYDYYYTNLNEQPMACEGNLQELVARRQSVMLIDYSNYDVQYKQTIFSGTNS